MVLENVNLPYYTKNEDKANSISHLVGVVFGAVATAVRRFITDFPREKRKGLQDLLTILSFLF